MHYIISNNLSGQYQMQVGVGLQNTDGFEYTLTEEDLQAIEANGGWFEHEFDLDGLVYTLKEEEEVEDEGDSEMQGDSEITLSEFVNIDEDDEEEGVEIGEDEEEDDEQGESQEQPSSSGSHIVQVYEDNGWVGIKGRFKVRFSNMDSDYPDIEIVPVESGKDYEPCYGIQDLPLERRNIRVAYINEYVPVLGPVVESADHAWRKEVTQTANPVEGEEQEVTYTETTKVRFFINVNMCSRKLLIKPENGSRYIEKDLLVSTDALGSTTAEQVYELMDFVGNPVGSLGYGCAYLPVDIPESGASNLFELDSRPMLFNIDEEHETFASDGFNCPLTIEAISPGLTAKDDGEVYDRYYEVEEIVEVSSKNLPLSANYIGVISMDKASTLKSIRTNATDNTYKDLEDDDVPESICTDIENLVDAQMRLQDSYFELMLSQLRQFLVQIGDELLSPVSIGEVKNLCVLRYSCEVTFPTHNREANYKASDGLFGFQNDLYEQCKIGLNNQMYSEFFNDYSTLVDREGIAIDTRSYHWILWKEKVL